VDGAEHRLPGCHAPIQFIAMGDIGAALGTDRVGDLTDLFGEYQSPTCGLGPKG